MTGLRVLHSITAAEHDEALLTDYTQRLRKESGCLEAEHYRSISNPERARIVELWDDQHVYGEYWARSLEEAEPNLVLRTASERTVDDPGTEFYQHRYFVPGKVWLAEAHQDHTQTVFWPSVGAIRIIIQISLHDVDAALEGLRHDVRGTVREPGCQEFDWLRSSEYPNHLLLVELWQDQAIYDAHWQLRIKTGGAGGGELAPREQGTNGFEFYRHEAFRHLYDRWLPNDVHRWSETVIWAD